MTDSRSVHARPNGQRGFNLIELLVVVTIVSILTGIGATSYVNYRMRARNTAAEADAGNFWVAQEAYRAKHDGSKYIPIGGDPTCRPPGKGYNATPAATFCGCLCAYGWAPTKRQGAYINISGLSMLGAAATSPTGFTLTANHPNGDWTYTLGSDTGGKVLGSECAGSCPAITNLCVPAAWPCDCPGAPNVTGANPRCSG